VEAKNVGKLTIEESPSELQEKHSLGGEGEEEEEGRASRRNFYASLI